jgi:hypothetical protein
MAFNSTFEPNILPWDWVLTPQPGSNKTCPAPSSVLGTFVAVNVITSLVSIISGHRRFIRLVTCGWLGEMMSQGWMRSWLLALGLQFAANATIAAIFKHTPGYMATFTIGELMLLFFARPRLSWIVLLFLSFYRTKNPLHIARGSERDYPYYSACMSQIMVELVMQLIALVLMGKTAYFATVRGFYNINSTGYRSLPESAHVMYAGALYYMVTGCLALAGMILLLGLTWLVLSGQSGDDGEGLTYMALDFIRMAFPVLLLLSTFLGSWLFWVGFVSLVGDKYMIKFSIYSLRR